MAGRFPSIATPPGSTLVLSTDGLVETREQDLDHGIDRQRRALQRHRDLLPEASVDAVLDELVDEHPADDVAVLVVRVRPDLAPVRRRRSCCRSPGPRSPGPTRCRSTRPHGVAGGPRAQVDLPARHCPVAAGQQLQGDRCF